MKIYLVLVPGGGAAIASDKAHALEMITKIHENCGNPEGPDKCESCGSVRIIELTGKEIPVPSKEASA